MNRRVLLFVFLLFVSLSMLFIAGLVLSDGAVFLREVWHYSDAAQDVGVIKLPSRTAESEAIVVLTGESGRIPKAVELLRDRPWAKLIISGTAPGIKLNDILNSQNRSGTNAQQIWKRIIIESESTSTSENARLSAKIIKSHKFSNVILVTTELHMLRSLQQFQRISPKIDFYAYPVPGALTELRQGKFSRLPSAVSKFVIEFSKYLVFKHRLHFEEAGEN